jgi:hypothetical protein
LPCGCGAVTAPGKAWCTTRAASLAPRWRIDAHLVIERQLVRAIGV